MNTPGEDYIIIGDNKHKPDEVSPPVTFFSLKTTNFAFSDSLELT
jgi:hypothetical protein